jgi:hypothetical protein
MHFLFIYFISICFVHFFTNKNTHVATAAALALACQQQRAQTRQHLLLSFGVSISRSIICATA